MAIRWKDSARFDKLHPVMVLAALRVEEIYKLIGITEVIITSGNDSTHAAKSKHYDGKALDFRTKTIESRAVSSISAMVARALGPQFTVILEDLSQPNEHLHVQFNGE